MRVGEKESETECVFEASHRWDRGGEEDIKGREKNMKVLTAYPHLFI